nr:MAG TPA: hypothetical protein [Caudoviricetes sp.]
MSLNPLKFFIPRFVLNPLFETYEVGIFCPPSAEIGSKG